VVSRQEREKTLTTTTIASNGGATELNDPEVLLVDARTRTERELISRWAAGTHPNAQVIEHDDPQLATRLERGDDPLVVPVRVTWLPATIDPDASTGAAGDLVALFRPRRPPAALQRLMARRDGRARVTAGEPAHALQLRREFRAETGGAGGRSAFGAFVARRATVACDRAERLLIGDRYKVPRLVAEQITASAAFRRRVTDLAARLERPPDEVLDEVTADLQELAAVQSPPAIDVFRATMAPLHRKAWTVDADVDGLERLRELNRKHALVFLPSHRSYADPLVLADVLHRNDFPRNHVLGGNNMAFWPIGPLGKRAGLIFIRRSFGDDEVYKLAVREYFGHLVGKRFNLEWYMEGGRSRTGKLRPPRYGLLRHLVRALQEGPADDVMLVPVSIAYEQLQEVRAMAAEEGGAAKSAEGLGWLARYIRGQSRSAGTARVRFGEPLSLQAALEDAGEGSAQLEKVAFRVCNRINSATPVTATSLVSFALLGVRDRALTLAQVRKVVAPLLDHLDARGIEGPADDLRGAGALTRTLGALEQAGVVSCFADGAEPVWSIAPGRQHVAAFYRNGALHHFLNRAILELAVERIAEEGPGVDAEQTALEDALALRDLLKFEFFFKRKQRFRDELIAERDVLGWHATADSRLASEGAERLLAGAPILVAPGTLRSFVEAQLVVADRLAARNPREAIDKDAFVRECLGYGRQLLLQGRIHSAESLSRELFGGALRLAANRDLVDPGRDDVRAAREAWRDELEEVRGRLAAIARIDAQRLEEVLDGDAR
jgi:glycerol-3-phosphate O-acyltransferase